MQIVRTRELRNRIAKRTALFALYLTTRLACCLMLRVECGKLNNARSKDLLETLKMSLGESLVEITGCSEGSRNFEYNERWIFISFQNLCYLLKMSIHLWTNFLSEIDTFWPINNREYKVARFLDVIWRVYTSKFRMRFWLDACYWLCRDGIFSVISAVRICLRFIPWNRSVWYQTIKTFCASPTTAREINDKLWCVAAIINYSHYTTPPDSTYAPYARTYAQSR